jgi:hypothetical protein
MFHNNSTTFNTKKNFGEAYGEERMLTAKETKLLFGAI